MENKHMMTVGHYKRNKAMTDNGCLYTLWATQYDDDRIKLQNYYQDYINRGETHEEIVTINSFFKFSGPGYLTFDDCPMPSTLFTTREDAERALGKQIERLEERIADNVNGGSRNWQIERNRDTLGILKHVVVKKLTMT
jgi:hypothetical protein